MAEARVEVRSWCRAGCGTAVVATVEDGVIRGMRDDPESPLGRSMVPSAVTCDHRPHAAADPRRLLRPRKRVGSPGEGRWEELSWEQATREIAGRLKDLRRQSGPSSLALLAGRPVGDDLRGALRTLGGALAWGTPHLYTPLAEAGGPWLQAAQGVIGRVSPLQGDIGRAHYVLLLSADPHARGWGPLQQGQGLGADLAHSRKTKSTKVIAVDARRTQMAAAADLHLSILPGTELFFVLGMIRAILDNKWQDAQFIRDYTRDIEALEAALAPWPLARCAEACGLQPGDIQGVALKFARAAMAVCWRGHGALSSRHSGLTAWAILALHGITANLLRPGGIYEPPGPCDLSDLRDQLPAGTARSGHATLLMQAPAAALAADLHHPGEGQPRALLALHADPWRELPGGPDLHRRLDDLDLLVAVDAWETETVRRAHYALPATDHWEQPGLRLLDGATLPVRHAAATPALARAPGEARDLAVILRDLLLHSGPALQSPLPLALRLMGGRLAAIDLAAWERRYWERNSAVPWEDFAGKPWEGGDLNRAHGTPSHPDGRMHLLPPAYAAALRELQPPAPIPAFPLRLLGSAARDPLTCPAARSDAGIGADPGVTLHPRHGIAAGARARIVTAAGSVEAVVRVDAGLHPDAVDLPAGYAADVFSLIPADALDTLSGTAALDGLPCRVEAA